MILGEQVVLITGGAGAIGRHLVDDMAGRVQHVHAVDLDEEALDDLSRDADNVSSHACDLTDYEAVLALMKTLFEAGPAPTVLVNNAGLIHSEPLVNIMSRDDRKHDVASWHRTLDVNLNSVFYMALCFADEMARRRSKGVIVNVSSITAAGNAGQSAYAAAKAAVNALTATWSKELGMLGIRCAAIAPGFIDTPSTSKALSEAHIKSWKKKTPLGRLGTVEEVAGALRFIIENDFFTGRVLGLDGGLSL